MPPISKRNSIPEFLRQMENSSEETALSMARESLMIHDDDDNDRSGCPCPHLQVYFPHGPLDLDFVNDGKRRWRLRNPIHQVHLESQPLGDLLVITDETTTTNPLNPPSPPIILYGEEHERLMALQKLANVWHPHLEHPPAPPSRHTPTHSAATTTTAAAAAAFTTESSNHAVASNRPTTSGMPPSTSTTTTITAPPNQNTTLISSLLSTPGTTTSTETDPSNTPQPPVSQTTTSATTSKEISTTTSATTTASLAQVTDATANDTNIQPQAITSASENDLPSIIEDKPKPQVNSTSIPMDTTTSTTITTTIPKAATTALDAPTKTQPYSLLLPESTFFKWHTSEAHIQTWRYMFLGKRSSSSWIQPLGSKITGNSSSISSSSGNGNSNYSKKSKQKQPPPPQAQSSLSDSHPMHSRYFRMMMHTAAASWKQQSQEPKTKESTHSSSSSHSPILSSEALEWYETRQKQIVMESEEMMERFRNTRQRYYHYYQQQNHSQPRHSSSSSLSPLRNNHKHPEYSRNAFQTPLSRDSTFGSILSGTKRRFSATNGDDDDDDDMDDRNGFWSDSPVDVYPPQCHLCSAGDGGNPVVAQNDGRSVQKKFPFLVLPCQNNPKTDTMNSGGGGGPKEILQCLECSFVGCMVDDTNHEKDDFRSYEPKHAVQHWLTSRHKFAVTCGAIPRIYCFECGDYVYHNVFDQEDERVEVSATLPWMAWKEHAVLRSADVWRFAEIPDLGIFWKGPQASYPILVPREHVKAMRRCRHRQIVFHGDLDALPVKSSRETQEFAVRQFRNDPNKRWRLGPPVGMYNLGNTCFMSAILQCLLHCTSLQRYFLRDVGHDHESCAIYRSMEGLGNAPAFARGKSKQAMNVCLACEMDKIFLQNLSSTTGVDVLTAVSRRLPNEVFAPSSNGDKSRRTTLVKRGEPLIPSTMLTSVWKCGGMKHLAGYDQRDAHEFLHSFLEILGEHVKLYRSNVQKAINMARPDNAIQELNGVENSPQNEIKKLFEGTLRSVLICQSCGVKRAKPEPFMSISLPLSKEIQLMMANTGPDHSGVEKLSVELCLQHFTMPEKLSDPVHCPNCGKKTPTKKQHVVSKLPKILCLHLKRFDAATNKKIEEFVSFPSYGLNMGLYLPHWCELYRAVSLSSADVDGGFTPELQYDLFATVNHFGNLQSGHYVSNLKVGGKWYHCNDSHVSFAGADSGEAEVLKSEGAYVLFYMRR